ncbi:MAG: hypothetical protein ABSB88_09035 [Bryobacteraceae bacterium]|jgi:uncharacterized BrkB/YihY/UPF0761 family membrane protein
MKNKLATALATALFLALVANLAAQQIVGSYIASLATQPTDGALGSGDEASSTGNFGDGLRNSGF